MSTDETSASQPENTAAAPPQLPITPAGEAAERIPAPERLSTPEHAATASAGSAPAWFSPQTAGQSALAGVVGVSGALAGAVVVAVLTLLFALVTGSSADGPTPPIGAVPDVDVTGLPFVGAIIWIATLGLFGQVQVGMTGGAFGIGGSAVVGAVPILALLGAVVGATWWAFRSERASRSASRVALGASAGISGLSAAAVILVLALIGRTSVTAGSGSGTYEVTSLTVPSLLGAAVTIALAATLGRWLARSLPGASFGRALWLAPTRFRWGTRDLYDHLVVLSALFVPVSLVLSFVIGQGAPVMWPFAIGQLAIASASIGHLGGYGFTASIPIHGDVSGAVSLFRDVPPSGWLLVIVAVIAAVTASVLIAARRSSRPVAPQRAWVLPALTVAGALVFGMTLGSALLFGSAGAAGVAASFGGSVSPAWWTYLVAFVWGIVVEALARFVAPTLLTTWPALSRFAPAGSASPMSTQGSSGTAIDPQPTMPSAAHPAEPAPLSPRAKRNVLIGGIVVGAIVLVGIVGAVVVNVLKSTVFSPAIVAQSYLDDIAAGRFESAFDATAGGAAGSTDLVSSNAVALTAGLEDVRLGAAQTTGGSTSIPVTYEIGGQRGAGTVTLSSAGTAWVFFDQWQIESGLETQAFVAGAPVSIGGITVDPGDDALDLIAYPGVYPVEAETSRWESVDVAPLTVTELGGQLYAEVSPSDDLIAKVQDLLDARLDECAESTDLEPEGCPFAGFAWGETRSVEWTIDDYPVVDLYDTETFSATGGAATATFERQDWNDEWAADEDTANIYILSGSISIDGDSVTIDIGG